MDGLKKKAKLRNVFLILDDIWEEKHLSQFFFIDTGTPSCVLVTSRTRGLVPSTMEVELGALPLRDAVVLLLRVARASNVDMTQPACDVVQACGRIPLLLTIVGTFMKDRLPRRCLTEDYANEVIYCITGSASYHESWDCGVAGKFYERAISESFRRCRGPDPDQVRRFFICLPCFPRIVRCRSSYLLPCPASLALVLLPRSATGSNRWPT